eukprot:3417878-Amphidinium_carterae.1
MQHQFCEANYSTSQECSSRNGIQLPSLGHPRLVCLGPRTQHACENPGMISVEHQADPDWFEHAFGFQEGKYFEAKDDTRVSTLLPKVCPYRSNGVSWVASCDHLLVIAC